MKYTQNYMSRTIVDFDNGSIMVETLDDKSPKESLRNAIVTPCSHPMIHAPSIFFPTSRSR